MKKILLRLIIPFALAFITVSLYSQDKVTPVKVSVPLQKYLSDVAKGNLGYISEQFNVSIAEAGLKAAKVFPDPEVSATYSDNEDSRLHMGKGLETGLSYSVNTGNKRGAGIALAKSNLKLEESALLAYFQNLKADAALSYYSACMGEKMLYLEKETYQRMSELSKADSIRFKDGEILEIDAMQSALEAKTQLNRVLQSEAELKNILVNLSVIIGKTPSDTLYVPSDSFPQESQIFILPDLIQTALKNRSDLQVAICKKEVSEKTVNLLRANRAFEFNVEGGYAHNAVSTNNIAPAPAYNSYSLGISIPLKFSSLNRGEVLAAKYAVEQNELVSKAVEQQIVSEVTQAYNLYMSKENQLEHYRQGWIENAEAILKGRIYLYQRGECGLVDVLNAQHSYIDLRKEYIETLFEYSSALIDLKHSAAVE
ncbi:MAG: TolC family protein [Bacteroidales bacterium]|nr:TolC family protein [Bacteroidales bacterium]